MSLIALIMAPWGRVNRLPFWLILILALVVTLLLRAAVHAVQSPAGKWLLVAVMFVLCWVPLCVTVKRAHDVGLRAWWLAALSVYLALYAVSRPLLPLAGAIHATAFTIFVAATIIGGIAALVIGCLDGTRGGNRFGADPLGREPPSETLADARSVTLQQMLAAHGYEVRRFPLRAKKIEIGVPGEGPRAFATDVQFVPWARSELREKFGLV